MSTAEEVREAEERQAASLLVGALSSLAAAVEMAEKDPTPAGNGLDSQALADAIALVQDLRKRLALVELDLAAVLGRREGKISSGELSDGRQFKLARAADRKEWDHDDWKRDVRRSIIDAMPKGLVLVDTDTGEQAPLGPTLQVVLQQAQEVHGSTAPRSTSLKPLGLYATDYCTSSPSGWRFTAVPPTTKPEDTTDA